MKGNLPELFIEAVHDDCRVLFLVEIRPHIDILCFVVHKSFSSKSPHFKIQATGADKQHPRITHHAMESVRCGKRHKCLRQSTHLFRIKDFTEHETEELSLVGV